MQKIVTVFLEDTMGLTKLLNDYVVEATLTKLDESKTKIEFHHFYSTKSLKVKLLNLVIRPKLARESQDTLNAMKKAIENEKPND